MNQYNPTDNFRLLIVDDNRSIHDDFKKVLGNKTQILTDLDEEEARLFGDESKVEEVERPWFQMDSAFQGENALGMVQNALAAGCPYAVAFIDVRMPPGWDGIQTTAKIWEIDSDIQVVICTAYSDYSWGEMLHKLGPSDRLMVLKKPFDNIEVTQLAYCLARKWRLLQESKRRMADLEQTVRLRADQIACEQEKFKGIFDNSPEGIFQMNSEGRFTAANPALAVIYGYSSPQELMERSTDVNLELYVDPIRRAEWQRQMNQQKVVRAFESEIHCADGTTKWISETARTVTKPDGSLLYYQGFVVDVTTERNAKQEHNLMEAHLRQAQKLESIGQLAAGIAHEINTPTQYIGDNTLFVQESFRDFNQLILVNASLLKAVKQGVVTPELIAEVEAAAEVADVEFMSVEIPKAIEEALLGVSRVAKIVRAMKEFSHPGSGEKVRIDINHAIENTLTVCASEWRYVAEVATDLDPSLPPVSCLSDEFNQVILNLVVNASHAIAEFVKKGDRGKITLRTRREKNWAEIRISDTGNGIPDKIRHRIFDPFFTTKPVGKGTGQGLAIARSVVVDKHAGTLTFETEMGRGTTFIIRLPLVDGTAVKI